ncbi:hypothetical protein GCM10022240_25750 [Microbacterium kribbense]|uniref:MFS transporter permease n=1 Tax=Microbacterium kribbense TaxID=433645 RepID=A0ABP7GQE3_9MICO
MLLRRGFFVWLLPAALILPVWLVVGWAIFSASGWALLGVLLVAAPSVLVGEVIAAMLIRARPTVRRQRAVSWQDVLAVSVWHVLVIAFGCFFQYAFVPILILAILAFLGLFWSSLGQLWGEARGSFAKMTPGTGPGDLPYEESVADRARQHGEVIIVNEVGRPGDGRSTH